MLRPGVPTAVFCPQCGRGPTMVAVMVFECCNRSWNVREVGCSMVPVRKAVPGAWLKEHARAGTLSNNAGNALNQIESELLSARMGVHTNSLEPGERIVVPEWALNLCFDGVKITNWEPLRRANNDTRDAMLTVLKLGGEEALESAWPTIAALRGMAPMKLR